MSNFVPTGPMFPSSGISTGRMYTSAELRELQERLRRVPLDQVPSQESFLSRATKWAVRELTLGLLSQGTASSPNVRRYLERSLPPLVTAPGLPVPMFAESEEMPENRFRLAVNQLTNVGLNMIPGIANMGYAVGADLVMPGPTFERSREMLSGMAGQMEETWKAPWNNPGYAIADLAFIGLPVGLKAGQVGRAGVRVGRGIRAQRAAERAKMGTSRVTVDADVMPTEVLGQFRQGEPTGRMRYAIRGEGADMEVRFQDPLMRDIYERGLQDPLEIGVDPTGRARLIEGNRRLEAINALRELQGDVSQRLRKARADLEMERSSALEGARQRYHQASAENIPEGYSSMTAGSESAERLSAAATEAAAQARALGRVRPTYAAKVVRAEDGPLARATRPRENVGEWRVAQQLLARVETTARRAMGSEKHATRQKQLKEWYERETLRIEEKYKQDRALLDEAGGRLISPAKTSGYWDTAPVRIRMFEKEWPTPPSQMRAINPRTGRPWITEVDIRALGPEYAIESLGKRRFEPWEYERPLEEPPLRAPGAGTRAAHEAAVADIERHITRPAEPEVVKDASSQAFAAKDAPHLRATVGQLSDKEIRNLALNGYKFKEYDPALVQKVVETETARRLIEAVPKPPEPVPMLDEAGKVMRDAQGRVRYEPQVLRKTHEPSPVEAALAESSIAKNLLPDAEIHGRVGWPREGPDYAAGLPTRATAEQLARLEKASKEYEAQMALVQEGPRPFTADLVAKTRAARKALDDALAAVRREESGTGGYMMERARVGGAVDAKSGRLKAAIDNPPKGLRQASFASQFEYVLDEFGRMLELSKIEIDTLIRSIRRPETKAEWKKITGIDYPDNWYALEDLFTARWGETWQEASPLQRWVAARHPEVAEKVGWQFANEKIPELRIRAIENALGDPEVVGGGAYTGHPLRTEFMAPEGPVYLYYEKAPGLRARRLGPGEAESGPLKITMEGRESAPEVSAGDARGRRWDVSEKIRRGREAKEKERQARLINKDKKKRTPPTDIPEAVKDAPDRWVIEQRVIDPKTGEAVWDPIKDGKTGKPATISVEALEVSEFLLEEAVFGKFAGMPDLPATLVRDVSYYLSRQNAATVLKRVIAERAEGFERFRPDPAAEGNEWARASATTLQEGGSIEFARDVAADRASKTRYAAKKARQRHVNLIRSGAPGRRWSKREHDALQKEWAEQKKLPARDQTMSEMQQARRLELQEVAPLQKERNKLYWQLNKMLKHNREGRKPPISQRRLDRHRTLIEEMETRISDVHAKWEAKGRVAIAEDLSIIESYQTPEQIRRGIRVIERREALSQREGGHKFPRQHRGRTVSEVDEPGVSSAHGVSAEVPSMMERLKIATAKFGITEPVTLGRTMAEQSMVAQARSLAESLFRRRSSSKTSRARFYDQDLSESGVYGFHRLDRGEALVEFIDRRNPAQPEIRVEKHSEARARQIVENSTNKSWIDPLKPRYLDTETGQMKVRSRNQWYDRNPRIVAAATDEPMYVAWEKGRSWREQFGLGDEKPPIEEPPVEPPITVEPPIEDGPIGPPPKPPGGGGGGGGGGEPPKPVPGKSVRQQRFADLPPKTSGRVREGLGPDRAGWKPPVLDYELSDGSPYRLVGRVHSDHSFSVQVVERTPKGDKTRSQTMSFAEFEARYGGNLREVGQKFQSVMREHLQAENRRRLDAGEPPVVDALKALKDEGVVKERADLFSGQKKPPKKYERTERKRGTVRDKFALRTRDVESYGVLPEQAKEVTQSIFQEMRTAVDEAGGKLPEQNVLERIGGKYFPAEGVQRWIENMYQRWGTSGLTPFSTGLRTVRGPGGEIGLTRGFPYSDEATISYAIREMGKAMFKETFRPERGVITIRRTSNDVVKETSAFYLDNADIKRYMGQLPGSPSKLFMMKRNSKGVPERQHLPPNRIAAELQRQLQKVIDDAGLRDDPLGRLPADWEQKVRAINHELRLPDEFFNQWVKDLMKPEEMRPAMERIEFEGGRGYRYLARKRTFPYADMVTSPNPMVEMMQRMYAKFLNDGTDVVPTKWNVLGRTRENAMRRRIKFEQRQQDRYVKYLENLPEEVAQYVPRKRPTMNVADWWDTLNDLQRLMVLYTAPKYYFTNAVGNMILLTFEHHMNPVQVVRSLGLRNEIMQSSSTARTFNVTDANGRQMFSADGAPIVANWSDVGPYISSLTGEGLASSLGGHGVRPEPFEVRGFWSGASSAIQRTTSAIAEGKEFARFGNRKVGAAQVVDKWARETALMKALRDAGYDTPEKVASLVWRATKGAEETAGPVNINVGRPIERGYIEFEGRGPVRSHRNADARELARIGDEANRSIVDFANVDNAAFEGKLKRLIFFYPWMKGSGLYSLRFISKHPVQTAVYTQASQWRAEKTKEELGGAVPSFMTGVLPMGTTEVPGLGKVPQVTRLESLSPFSSLPAAAATVAGTLMGNPRQTERPIEWVNPLVAAAFGISSGVDPATGRPLSSNPLIRGLEGMTEPWAGAAYLRNRLKAEQIREGEVDPNDYLIPASGKHSALARFALAAWPTPYNPKMGVSRAYAERWAVQDPFTRENLQLDLLRRQMQDQGAPPPTERQERGMQLQAQRAAYTSLMNDLLPGDPTQVDRLEYDMRMAVQNGIMERSEAERVLLRLAAIQNPFYRERAIENYRERLNKYRFGGYASSRYLRSLRRRGYEVPESIR